MTFFAIDWTIVIKDLFSLPVLFMIVGSQLYGVYGNWLVIEKLKSMEEVFTLIPYPPAL